MKRYIPWFALFAGCVVTTEIVVLGLGEVRLRSDERAIMALARRASRLPAPTESHSPRPIKDTDALSKREHRPRVADEPWRSVDVYFSAREIAARLRAKARSEGVLLREHETFALQDFDGERDRNTGEGSAAILEAVDQIGTRLLESKPTALLSIRRSVSHGGMAGSGGKSSTGDRFVIDSRLIPPPAGNPPIGVQVVFSGPTTVLREFVNRLAERAGAQVLQVQAESLNASRAFTIENLAHPGLEKFTAVVVWTGLAANAEGPAAP
ncbi:MAG TPA: hypothetical protein VHD32_11030 [Candidatus Didemnitutus sp.]|nr:hypothetical protein [Candidatus Didemnitutus sp.]